MVRVTWSAGAKVGGEQGYANDEGSEQCMAVRGGGGGGGDGGHGGGGQGCAGSRVSDDSGGGGGAANSV